MRRIILDLFAGPGGLSHALAVPGARNIGVDSDPPWQVRAVLHRCTSPPARLPLRAVTRT
ncbi:hypothetical protein SAMN05444921_120124 [Streptomyces wuyuanensis]|uniref:DNA (cytosine-5-)-methyltransferase n=1 Tax=Streptomyces wuyuanensis TaxID=1196353 RepID=A0A1G9Z567_9ACTN|nr:hypothetical protein SAMN05444921_120124 [Streptomyces wuyuanensis]